MTYDEWVFRTPWDDDPEPCECGEDDCTCAEDAECDRADFEYEKRRDAEMEATR